ncbi:nitroreductase family protein [Amycolatopsis nigrescens]|uniref:nitroreductase family protein n=1 Tax=Amycolatopsis nigrescens TaxID=381445 RepID=UPI00037B9777|nr:nitroreductase family protein [Amycolatopsis nigrescens]
MEKPASTSVPVHELIARRWSPRALDETGVVSEAQLRAVLEAARWSASYGNTQPARYLVGLRGDETFDRILGTLTVRNQSWAHRAGALLIGLAVTRNEKGEIPYAEYGLGLASQNLVLQAVAEGLVAHQMAGFDRNAVAERFTLPADVRPLVAIAIGTAGEPEVLGEERDIARERSSRERIPLAEFAFTGDWGNPLSPLG